MNDFDRKLVDLIAELTDEGVVNSLDLFVDHYGREFCTRVIEDDFAVVRHVPFDDNFREAMDRTLWEGRFVPTDDALRQVGEPKISLDYFLSAGPWAPIGLEDQPNLIFRYAADEPEAVDEVRQRNAERRKAWERKRKSPQP